MSAEFTRTRTRISTNRYQMMVAAGELTKYDRVELIEGDMLDRAPIGTKHSAMTRMVSPAPRGMHARSSSPRPIS